MNLNEIKTVSDLIEQNNGQSFADEVIDQLMDAGIVIGHEVCVRLVGAAIDFHRKELADKATQEDLDAMDIILWTKDLTNLEHAKAILETIDLGQDSNEEAE